MKNLILKSKSIFSTSPCVGETNSMISETIPDDVIDIRELILRYSRGEDVVTHSLIYDSDVGMEIIDPRRMDLADITARREELEEQKALQDLELEELKQLEEEKISDIDSSVNPSDDEDKNE